MKDIKTLNMKDMEQVNGGEAFGSVAEASEFGFSEASVRGIANEGMGSPVFEPKHRIGLPI